ncbi:MAG: hypothetical protein GF308_08085 [Candidatus Heimdallarchaeota archaeon]|nr:hypothetical protein [Candidatus Heimdallarchaeota archaeon]
MLLVITLTETTNYRGQKRDFVVLKWLLGAFRLIHVLPVFCITSIATLLAYYNLEPLGSLTPIILFILTVFFEAAFLGVQNDYLDRDLDRLYEKRKAIADGWIPVQAAFWLAVFCYLALTACSIGLGYYAKIGYWVVLFVQGVTLLGMIYNYYAKHTPFSIVPLIIAFPLIPVFVWLCFGGFTLRSLWFIPMIIFVAFSGHVANELPDYEKDKEFGKRNFTVFFGKKRAIILCWAAALLAQLLVILAFIFYPLYLWAFIGIMGLNSLLIMMTIVILWKRRGSINVVIFDLITAYLGINIVGLIVILR